MKQARFRFYAELNDFLPAGQRQTAVNYAFTGSPGIKDAIEAMGVPHPEVDLIIVNGTSVGWDHRLAPDDVVAVYPVFEAVDISPIIRLRPRPLRTARFVLDAHLGRLARRLRMLGFDSLFDAGYRESQVVEIAARGHRTILTRNRSLLKNNRVTHGYWVRATDPEQQLREVVDRLDLRTRFDPFTRCMECNGTIEERTENEVADRVPPRARARTKTFFQCGSCGKIYWEGTHVEQMRRQIEELSGPAPSL